MKERFIYYLFCLLLVLGSCNEPAKLSNAKKATTSNAEITALMEEALTNYDNGNYAKSQQIFAAIDSLVTPATDTILRIRLLFNKTELLKLQGEYESCIENYYEASKLAKLMGDSTRLGLAYYNISSTHFLMKNLEEADKYNLLAQTIYKNTTEKNRLMNCYILYSSICRHKKKLSQAKKYLDKAIKFYEEKGEEIILAICMNNYANLLLEEEKSLPAIEYYEKAVRISKKLNDQYALASRLGNLGEVYLLENQFQVAKAYIDSSLKIARKIDAKETILSNLERQVLYYERQKNFEKALEFSTRLIDLKTELLQLESSEIIQSVEEKYKSELEFVAANNKITLLEKDKEVTKKEQERTRLKLYFVIFLSVLLIIVAYIIYIKQRKIREIDEELHNKEREILTSKNRLAETEKQQLTQELEFKRKELMTFSMTLSEREKFLTAIKTIFLKIKPNEIPQKEILQELKNTLYNINNDGSFEIHNQIEKINSSFHFNLKSNHPNLSEDDIRLASLLVLGLSSKEIANMLTIEAKSVDMKRYRLKKKLNLESKIELKEFLTRV